MLNPLVTRVRRLLGREAKKTPAANESVPDVITRAVPDAALGFVAQVKPVAVTGWAVASDPARSALVEIVLNGRTVATTVACQVAKFNGSPAKVGFTRKLRGLWKFLGPEDRVEVRCGGKILPMRHGYHYCSKKNNVSRSEELFAQLDAGYVFNKYGVLALSIQKDLAWQKGISKLFWKLQKKLKKAFGVNLQVTYGTLLSAIREGDFIGHDNDFDTCYISRHKTARKVQVEFTKICEFLIDSGYQLKVKRSHTWVMVPGTEFKLDIFFAWFGENGEFQASYGHHGPVVTRSKAFFRMREVKLGAFTVNVPEAAEDLLCHFYGPNWRIPDPGFSHYTETRKLDRAYLLRTTQVSRLYWKQYYRDAPISPPSDFARFVLPKLPPGALILELGCGNGGDALFFAREGFSVVASDLSTEAIAKAAAEAKAGGLRTRCTFSKVDVRKVDQLKAELESPAVRNALESGQTVVVYLRLLLHAISGKNQARMFSALNEQLPKKWILCAEFFPEKDPAFGKRFRGHFQRVIKPSDLKAELIDKCGLKVTYLKQATGWAVQDEIDPKVCRIIAVRS